MLYFCGRILLTNKLQSMSVNKVILIGNVGKDPDVRYLESNQRVANFTLATTDRGYTLANGTQVPDRTEWHNIVVWRNTAEYVEKYVRKGALLYIEGRLTTRNYEDKSGIRHYRTEIYAEKLEILNSRRDNNAASTATQPTQVAQQQVAQPAPQPTAPVSPAATGDDSNLPF